MSIRDRATEIVEQLRDSESPSDYQEAVHQIVILADSCYSKGLGVGFRTQQEHPNADDRNDGPHRSQWREPLTGDLLRPKKPVSGDALWES